MAREACDATNMRRLDESLFVEDDDVNGGAMRGGERVRLAFARVTGEGEKEKGKKGRGTWPHLLI